MFEFLRKAHYNYSTDFNFVFNYPKFHEIKIWMLNYCYCLNSGSHFEFFTILQHKGMNTEKEMCISYTGKVLPLSETCPYTSKETLLSWAEFSEEVSKLQLSPEEFALMLGICVTFRGMYYA